MLLTPPVFVLMLGLELASGCMIAACGQSFELVFWPALMGALFALYLMVPIDERPMRWSKQATAILLLIIAIVPFAGFGYCRSRFPCRADNDLSYYAGRTVELEGCIDSALPLKGGKQARFICENLAIRLPRNEKSLAASGLTMLFVSAKAPFLNSMTPGAHLKCMCRVASLGELEKRGRGGYAGYLRRKGINSISYLRSGGEVLFVADGEKPANDADWATFIPNWIESSRAKIITAHSNNLGPVTGSLLTAMVLGEKAVGLDSRLLAEFRNVGLSHVLAASGFNLTVVTLSTNWLCRTLCMPVVYSNCLSFLLMVVFVLFAGNSPSVARAALMCAFAIAAKSCGRRVHIAGLLGGALLVSLLLDPLSVADPGFQLSYFAVAAVIFIVSPIAAFLELQVSRRWLRWVLDAVVTVMIAQASVLPLQLFYFKQMGLLFLPANLLASLVVTPVTVAGFASSLTVLCDPSELTKSACSVLLANLFGFFCHSCVQLLDWLAALPLYLLVETVHVLSGCQWALVKFPPIEVWQVLLYYVLLILSSTVLIRRLKASMASRLERLNVDEGPDFSSPSIRRTN